MHVFHCLVGLSSLQCNKSISELTLSCEHIVWPKLHLKEIQDLVKVFLCFIVVNGLDVLYLVVNHRVQILFNDELFPNLYDFLEESLCFDN